MGYCTSCEVKKDCFYPFKPTECFDYRKFWNKGQRKNYDKDKKSKNSE